MKVGGLVFRAFSKPSAAADSFRKLEATTEEESLMKLQ